MNLTIDNTTVKNVLFNGAEVGKFIFNGEIVYESTVTVTYIYNGSPTTVKVKKGALVSNYVPASVSGKTFVGWSTSKDSTTVKTIYAESDMTLYGVYKQTITKSSNSNPTTFACEWTSASVYVYCAMTGGLQPIGKIRINGQDRATIYDEKNASATVTIGAVNAVCSAYIYSNESDSSSPTLYGFVAKVTYKKLFVG